MIEVQPLSVYAVGIFVNGNILFLARYRTDNAAKTYKASIDLFGNEIITFNKLEDVALFMDNVTGQRIYNATTGNTLMPGYSLFPVLLNVTAEDMTQEVGDMDLLRKRAAALSKLTTEDKEILGLL